MAELARAGSPELRRLVSLCSGGEDPLGCLDAIIRDRYRFRDEWNEVVRTPRAMLDDLETRGFVEGDCDCVSTFFCAGALALGYPCRFVAIKTEDGPDFAHVFTEALESGRWRRFDATVPLSLVDVEVEYGRFVQYV